MTDTNTLVSLIGQEFDKAKTDINLLYDIYNIDYITDDLLNIVAAYFEYNMSYIGDSDFHRNNLKVIVDSYRFKGSKPSFDNLMSALGYSVKIVPLWTANRPLLEEESIKV